MNQAVWRGLATGILVLLLAGCASNNDQSHTRIETHTDTRTVTTNPEQDGQTRCEGLIISGSCNVIQEVGIPAGSDSVAVAIANKLPQVCSGTIWVFGVLLVCVLLIAVMAGRGR